jgi:4'-phosphopantetheinyl transferase EntD
LLESVEAICLEDDPRDAEATDGLWPEELERVRRAVPKRQREYACTRRLARRAFQQLGRAPAALLNDDARAPIWPQGLLGSVTHTASWCAVAVARSQELAALGIDVEAATPLARELIDRICLPGELARLDAFGSERLGLLAKAVFSAKESFYKALFPRAREFLEFGSVSLELEPRGSRRFEWWATLERPWGDLAAGSRIGPGQLALEDELVASALWQPASG